jgi:hypothetical protein
VDPRPPTSSENVKTADRGRRPPVGRKFLLLLVLFAIVGATSTFVWLKSLGDDSDVRAQIEWMSIVAAGLCVPFTLTNLCVRWFRWHFLIRRFTPELVTRDSFAAYWATLPALLSPFLIAELGRVLLIRRRFQTPAAYLVHVWIGERFMDASLLGVVLLFQRSVVWGVLGLVTFLIVAISVGSRALAARSFGSLVAIVLGTTALTVVAWAFPIVALSAVVRVLGDDLSLSSAAHIFSESTLFGGLTGLR